MQLPTPQEKFEMYTDGNDDYKTLLPEYYAETCMNYGQLVKHKKNGVLVEKEKRVVYGNPDINDIETINVENHNGIIRERIGRFVRKTKCFTKKKSRMNSALQLFQFYWNFINEFKKGKSPAVMEGIQDYLWTWDLFLKTNYAA